MARTDLTPFMNKVNKVQEEIDNLKITVDRHAVLLGCACFPCPAHYSSHVHGVVLTPCMFCGGRGHTSSMMLSVHEVSLHAAKEVNLYEEPGSCQRAATNAKIFFTDHYTLMQPQVLRGVLYAPSGGLVLKATGGPPAKPNAVVHGRTFVMHSMGVWVELINEAAPAPELNAMGFTHYVTVVSTADGQRVAVDWGAGQFGSIPPDARLYLPL